MSAAVNVVLSDELYIFTNGFNVSRRTISSMIVIIVYLLSSNYIGMYRFTIINTAHVQYNDRRLADLPKFH